MSDEDLLNPPRFEAQLLKKQIISILTAWGMALEEADIASTVMIETDLRGVDSHGINMLRQYEETFKRGALNICLLYTSPSPRDATLSRMPSSA